jgi:glycyl-tRNA synthetase (class II)
LANLNVSNASPHLKDFADQAIQVEHALFSFRADCSVGDSVKLGFDDNFAPQLPKMRTMTTADFLTEIVILHGERVRSNTTNQPLVVKVSGDWEQVATIPERSDS